MHGNLNAIGLLLLVGLSIASIAIAGRRSCTQWRFLFSVLGAIVVMFIAISLSMHMCLAGEPFTQWLIPGTCVVAVSCFVEKKTLRRLVVSLLVIGCIGLSFHFSELVHWAGYTGNPNAA